MRTKLFLASLVLSGFVMSCSNKAKKSDSGQGGLNPYDNTQGLAGNLPIQAVINQGSATVLGGAISVSGTGSIEIMFRVDGGQVTSVNVQSAPGCTMLTSSSVRCDYTSTATISGSLNVTGTSSANQPVQQTFSLQGSTASPQMGGGFTPGAFGNNNNNNSSSSGGLLGGLMSKLGSGGGLLGKLIGALTGGNNNSAGSGLLGSVISAFMGNSGNGTGGGILSQIISGVTSLFGFGLAGDSEQGLKNEDSALIEEDFFNQE